MHDSMCLLNQYHIEKVGTPQKSISGKPFACNILYPKKKKKKKTFVKSFYNLSLEVDENDIWFSTKLNPSI